MRAQASRKPKLKVYTDAHRLFIHVPTERAESVRKHLINHGISSMHPEPVTPGTHSLELPAGTDAKAVQQLLDQWTKS